MWETYLLATKTGHRPSRLINIFDEWAAWQFDQAVMHFGLTIEALLEETENVGTDEKPRHALKYKLSDLLDDDYRVTRKAETVDMSELKGIHGVIMD